MGPDPKVVQAVVNEGITEYLALPEEDRMTDEVTREAVRCSDVVVGTSLSGRPSIVIYMVGVSEGPSLRDELAEKLYGRWPDHQPYVETTL